MTAPASAARRFYRLAGWLLTPLVAWAVSFLGGWIGAGVLGSVRGMVGGSVTGAVLGVLGWVVLMRFWANAGGNGKRETGNVV